MWRAGSQLHQTADTRSASIAGRLSINLGDGIGAGRGAGAEYILEDVVVISRSPGSTPSELDIIEQGVQ